MRNIKAQSLYLSSVALSKHLEDAIQQIENAVKKEMVAAAAYTAAATEAAIAEGMTWLGPIIPFNPISTAFDGIVTEKFLGTSLSAWGEHMKTMPLAKMAKEYQEALALGEDMEQVADRLMAAGIEIEGSAIKLARTGIQAAANEAQRRVYEANSHLIKKLMYTATLDIKTCEECGPLDGQLYDVGGYRPPVPLHPQCRCLYTPVMKSAKELGLGPMEIPRDQRESMDGRVPGTVDYSTWFSQQEQARQYEIIKMQYGKGKADAFLAGDFSPVYLEQFIS
jgi:SPP1 gp7 family putative phage head morphogenesis protein